MVTVVRNATRRSLVREVLYELLQSKVPKGTATGKRKEHAGLSDSVFAEQRWLCQSLLQERNLYPHYERRNGTISDGTLAGLFLRRPRAENGRGSLQVLYQHGTGGWKSAGGQQDGGNPGRAV